jgi:adenylate kinase family enzyme
MRISVVGGSCSGKTTLSRRLAQRLGITHIELDALHHGPNWDEAPAELLQERVREALAQAPHGWVVDGNYHGKIGRLVLDQADLVVFLDLQYGTVLRRSLWRTLSRSVMRRELWNGNRETFANALSKDSIVLWVIRTHRPLRAKMAERLAGRNVVHLRSPGDVERWFQSISVEDLAAQPLEIDVAAAEHADDSGAGLRLDEAGE